MNKMFWTICGVLLLSLPASAQDIAPADEQDPLSIGQPQVRLSDAERTASSRTKTKVYNQARQNVEALFERLCPGRCELVSLDVKMKNPKPVGQVTPGFESVSGGNFVAQPDAIQVSVLMDSKLPRNFQSNMPRMIQHQLRGLAPKVNVRPELLSFPEPQLAPMPPYLPEPPRQSWEEPPPKPEPEPQPELPTEEPPLAEVEPESSLWDDIKTLLAEVMPWVGPILMAIVLFVMMLILLRRIAALQNGASEGATGSSAPQATQDLDGLQAEFTQSRSLRNRVLRKWLTEDEDGLTDFVRWMGPAVLADLKTDPALQTGLRSVSQKMSERPDPLTSEEVNAVASKARARLVSEQVVFDSHGAEWEFLEGVGVPQLRQMLSSCSVQETIFVVGQLPAPLRAGFLETLNSEQRRALVLGSGAQLSKQETITLATRLRRSAEQFSHIGKGADGQAGLVVDMVTSLPFDDQIPMLRDLDSNRPELAERVMANVCLEGTVPFIPGETLADAVHRMPVETAADFLRGTKTHVREHLLSVAPASKRAAVMAELSLDVPVGKEAFLSARTAVLDTIQTLAVRDGFDLYRANAHIVRNTQHNPTDEV